MPPPPRRFTVQRQRTDPRFRPREALGLRLPDRLPCGHCSTQLISHIYWDAEVERLACIRCAGMLARLDPSRFLAVTLDARGALPHVGFLPAGQAIAVLIRFGAKTAE